MVIATVIGLLALFSILSILLSGDVVSDTQGSGEEEFPFWLKYGHR